MFPSLDAEFPKLTRLLWNMRECHHFWKFNISWREHSLQLKFLKYSNHKYSYLWAKCQLEITSFDLLVHTELQPKILLKSLYLWMVGLRSCILLGFFTPHVGLPYAQSSNSKTIYHLEGYLHQFTRSKIQNIRFRLHPNIVHFFVEYS